MGSTCTPMGAGRAQGAGEGLLLTRDLCFSRADAGSGQGVLCPQPPAPLCSPLLQPHLSLPETAKSPAAEGIGFPGALSLEDTEW